MSKHRGMPSKNIHHLIARERRDEGYNVECDQNKIELPVPTHEAIHRLFKNKTPEEQLAMWLAFTKNILAKDTRDRVREILQLEPEEFYISSLFR